MLEIEILESKRLGLLTNKAEEILISIVNGLCIKFKPRFSNKENLERYILNNWFKISDTSKSYNYYNELVKRKIVNDYNKRKVRKDRIKVIYNSLPLLIKL